MNTAQRLVRASLCPEGEPPSAACLTFVRPVITHVWLCFLRPRRLAGPQEPSGDGANPPAFSGSLSAQGNVLDSPASDRFTGENASLHSHPRSQATKTRAQVSPGSDTQSSTGGQECQQRRRGGKGPGVGRCWGRSTLVLTSLGPQTSAPSGARRHPGNRCGPSEWRPGKNTLFICIQLHSQDRIQAQCPSLFVKRSYFHFLKSLEIIKKPGELPAEGNRVVCVRKTEAKEIRMGSRQPRACLK